MRSIITFFILLIAFAAAVYSQRLFVAEWIRETMKPELPVAMEYKEVQEVGEVEEGQDPPERPNDMSFGRAGVEGGREREMEEEKEIVEEQEESKVLETEEKTIEKPKEVNLAVPFTPQAPYANWSEPYKEACEEASIFMVSAFYQHQNEGLIAAEAADREIQQIVAFEKELLGFYEDTTAEQTATIAELHYGLSGFTLLENPTVDQIKEQLALQHPVIVPAAGRLLQNPYFTPPGPVYHMLVIRGYTEDGQFIVNDPGTWRGEAYLYSYETLLNANHDWIGDPEKIEEGKKVMFVLSP